MTVKGKRKTSKSLKSRKPRRRIGDAPGHIVPREDTGPAHVHLFAFGPEGLEEVDPAVAKDVAHLSDKAVRWVDVDGFGAAEGWAELQKLLNLSSLAVEDAMTNQRAKAERFPEHDFLLIHMVRRNEQQRLVQEQLSLFFDDNWLVTAQEGLPGDVMDPVRQRLRRPGSPLLKRDSRYLAYAIADCVVDHYFPVVDDLMEKVQQLDQEIFSEPSPDVPARLTRVRRDINQLRRTLRPARDALLTLLPNARVGQAEGLSPFLSDLLDHANQLLDELEHLREQTAGLMDLYLSRSGQRMNEIMRTLTVISMVFMPLTFIAGVYGMNFDTSSPYNMPETQYRYGYPIAMSVMVVIAITLIVAFRREGWLRFRTRRRGDDDDG